MSGDPFGTNGTLRPTFFYSLGMASVLVLAFNTLSVITRLHEAPGQGIAGPIVWEGSSWVSLVLCFWIPWVAYRLAPPLTVRPRWKLLLHPPMALLFGLSHVVGFILLRKGIYWLAGYEYDFGPFGPHFLYEFSKDALGYALIISGFSTVETLLRQRSLIETPGQTLTFDIRDGGRLTRVQLDQVLAIASAGNYVEFVLSDGRRLMMRSPLSALENELSPRGFLRTHRSWLVNAKQMTALKPEGSGDYEVELGPLKVPLSRRFPQALEKLRGS
ncbi:MAG TPA: LytTR family DNA-binding domain-containing protein [Rhizomicrobium sp.]|nr:LytTR family DNA-binding domain-containing protein [Rhizomicrobium sp.]